MSLSSQLALIAAQLGSAPMDRKARQKLHLASLVYDAKTAATQDYDTIYAECVDLLHELVAVDSRFKRFHQSLFSETSILVDRNVQTAAEVQALDAATATFLALVGPYLHLQPAVGALEWLVRRFQIHLHQPEQLMVLVLPYHATPLFTRVLAIVKPLPHAFLWLQGYQKAQGSRPVPTAAVVKGMLNLDTLKVVSAFVAAQAKVENLYERQLVVYVAAVALAVALMAADPALLEPYVAQLLELAAVLLAAPQEIAKSAAHSILAVVAAVLPQSNQVSGAVLSLLFQGYQHLSEVVQRSAVVCAGRWCCAMPVEVTGAVASELRPEDAAELLPHVLHTHPLVLRFAAAYVLAAAATGTAPQLVLVLERLDDARVGEVVAALVARDASPVVVALLEWAATTRAAAFTAGVAAADTTVLDLEMKLAVLLLPAVEEAPVAEDGVDDDAPEAPAEDYAPATSTSFLLDSSSDFSTLLPVYTRLVVRRTQRAFLAKTFPELSPRLAFLLRVAATGEAPHGARVAALRLLRREVAGAPASNAVHLVVPTLVAIAGDALRAVRSAAVAVLEAVVARKLPSSKHSLAAVAELYGDDRSMLALPKDGRKWAERVVAVAPQFVADVAQYPHAVGSTVTDPVTLAFATLQAVVPTLPVIRARLLQVVGALRVKGAAAASELAADVVASYLASREELAAQCAATKFPVAQFDKAVATVAGNDIAFLANAVEHFPEVALPVLAKVFPTGDFSTQAAAAEQLLVSAPEVLESLPLLNLLLDRLLRGLVLAPAPERLVAKRRRRSLAAARQALRDELVLDLARTHLQRLATVLELVAALDATDSAEQLLATLFSLLADAETLGGDAGMPVLYVQETLALALMRTLSCATPEAALLRPDLVVAAVRSLPLPAVQTRLLAVVAKMAEVAPETVLHLVMPVFTFMGAHTVRQDDAFSAHVVAQTVAAVVPALGAARDAELVVALFALALPHVPRHRRVPLFVAVANALGPARAVPLVWFAAARQDGKGIGEFAEAFVGSFSAEVQLASVAAYVALVEELGLGAEELASRPIFGPLVAVLPQDQLEDLATSLLAFAAGCLGNSLEVKVAMAYHEMEPVEEPFAAALAAATRVQAAPLVAALVGLLPAHRFVAAAAPLLADPARAPEIASLAASKFAAADTEDAALVEAAASAVVLLADSKQWESAAVVVDRFGLQLEPATATSVLAKCVDGGKWAEHELVSCCVCIALCIQVLGVRLVGLFPQVVPVALKAFAATEDASVHAALVAVLACCVRRLPAFMGSSVAPLFTVLLTAAVPNATRVACVDAVVASLEPSVVLPAVYSVWLESLRAQDLGLLLHALAACVERVDRKSAAGGASAFVRFVLGALAIRNVLELDVNAVGRIEAQLLQTFVDYVLKLNDKSFRPLFALVVRWAFAGEGAGDVAESTRLWAMFRLWHKLQERLRGLATPYNAYVLEPCAKLLGEFAAGREDAGLKRAVLVLLALLFRNDGDEWWQQQLRFDVVCEALCQQFVAIEDGVGKHLVKAVVWLAQTAPAEDHAKALYAGIVGHMREEALAGEKLWAVRAMAGVFGKMGELWLPMVPQLVPVVAELLEDDDDKVEAEVRTSLVKAVERVLGEPLDRYLE